MSEVKLKTIVDVQIDDKDSCYCGLECRFLEWQDILWKGSGSVCKLFEDCLLRKVDIKKDSPIEYIEYFEKGEKSDSPYVLRCRKCIEATTINKDEKTL